MGQIRLNSAVSSFPTSQLQATPAKTNLPPAELSKQLSPTACPSPQDQNNLKQLSEGNSKNNFSFLDDEPQVDLPSAKEFMKLMQEVNESHKLRPSDAPTGPGHHRYLDETITQGKEQLEKIRQAAAQDPPSHEAVKMLWLLEEQNKIGQGYKYENLDHQMIFADTLQNVLKDTEPSSKPKESKPSPKEVESFKKAWLEQREKQAIDSIHQLLSP